MIVEIVKEDNGFVTEYYIILASTKKYKITQQLQPFFAEIEAEAKQRLEEAKKEFERITENYRKICQITGYDMAPRG